MSAHACAVDHLNVAIVSGGHRIHDSAPDAGLRPATEEIVAGDVRSIAFRQVGPGSPASQDREDAVQRSPVVCPGSPARLARQHRIDDGPLEIAHIVTRYCKFPSRSMNHGRPSMKSYI